MSEENFILESEKKIRHAAFLIHKEMRKMVDENPKHFLECEVENFPTIQAYLEMQVKYVKNFNLTLQELYEGSVNPSLGKKKFISSSLFSKKISKKKFHKNFEKKIS